MADEKNNFGEELSVPLDWQKWKVRATRKCTDPSAAEAASG